MSLIAAGMRRFIIREINVIFFSSTPSSRSFHLDLKLRLQINENILKLG